MPNAIVLSQGDEVLTGQTVDSNAAWLGERLTELGFTVRAHAAVGDRLEDIAALVTAASRRSELVVSTGGLGPTDDDLTAPAVAAAFDRPLDIDETALRSIEALYRRLGRAMADSNRKQALLPRGSLRLDNDWGTAPGFAVEEGGCLLAFLPGVPREMRALYEHRVLPLVRERFDLRPGRLVTLRCAGIGESDLQQRVGRLDDPRFVASYRTQLPENHLKLRWRAGTPEAEIEAVADALRERIGRPVFAVEGLGAPGGSLPEVVGRLLVGRDLRLAVAEWASAGRLATACTGLQGSGAWLLAAAVAPTADGWRALGWDLAMASEPRAAARQLAEEALRRSGAGCALATGPLVADVGEGRPGGWAALATEGETHERPLRLVGDRGRSQALAAGTALDLLRRWLQGLLDERT
jgi:competence/damage-inducible protein CinA-like protein